MVVALKVFKKQTPNGKIVVYLSKRDFIDHLDHSDPIDGVVVVEDGNYLQSRRIYGQVVIVYRYGREQDEVMGVKFSKEMVITSGQIVPQTTSGSNAPKLTSIQEKLVRKLGTKTAYPFTFHFPKMSPCSVTLQPAEDDEGKPLGVEYYLRIFVGDGEEDRGHKRSTVTLAIKKIQFAPSDAVDGTTKQRLPSALVSKGFTLSSGKINLEVTLDKEIYYHGERVAANLMISNNSRKSVRNIKALIVQHCEVTMVNMQFSKFVATMETREGCPIMPGASLTKVIYLVPLASNNRDKRGIALDGRIKDDDANLASSTLVPEGMCAIDAIGIVISYSFRIRLNCGTLGGELVADVPFKLLNPAPGTQPSRKSDAMKKRSMSRTMSKTASYENDDDDNIVFEDFARFRMSRDEME